MDNKNKDIKNKDNNNLENKDTNNNDKEQKNINEMSPEELDKAIIDLLEKMGAENDIKIINGKPKYGLKTKVIGFLKLLFSFIVLVALTGFINWIQYDKFYIALLGMLTIVCVDFIIGKILMKFFMIAVLKTFGVLKLLESRIRARVSSMLMRPSDVKSVRPVRSKRRNERIWLAKSPDLKFA